MRADRNEVAEARAEARRAYGRAKAMAGTSSVLIDRWWAETLSCIDGQRAPTKVEMLNRTRALFDLVADRATWVRWCAIAMVVAKAYPEQEEGWRGKKSPVTGRFPIVKQQCLAEARTVVEFAPDLADAVLAGREARGSRWGPGRAGIAPPLGIGLSEIFDSGFCDRPSRQEVPQAE
jgi:hypothetical protein